MAGPALQAPATHWSPTVQTLPSEQGVLSGVWLQPLAPQTSAVHGLPSSQLMPTFMHLLPLHMLCAVHGSPSSQVLLAEAEAQMPGVAPDSASERGRQRRQSPLQDSAQHTPFRHRPVAQVAVLLHHSLLLQVLDLS